MGQAGVVDDTRPDLDQFEFKVGERPICHFFGQRDAAQEGGQVVSEGVQLQPDRVVAELPA